MGKPFSCPPFLQTGVPRPPTAKRFPLELDIGAGDQKTTVMGLPGGERSLTIFSAVWIEYTNIT